MVIEHFYQVIESCRQNRQGLARYFLDREN